MVTAAPATLEAAWDAALAPRELVGASAVNGTQVLVAPEAHPYKYGDNDCYHPSKVNDNDYWCPSNMCNTIRCVTEVCVEAESVNCRINVGSMDCADDGWVVKCTDSQSDTGLIGSETCRSYCGAQKDWYQSCDRWCTKWAKFGEGYQGQGVNYFSSCNHSPGEWLMNYCPGFAPAWQKPEPPPCNAKCKACKKCDADCQKAYPKKKRGAAAVNKQCYQACNEANDCGFGPQLEPVWTVGVHQATVVEKPS